RRGISMNPDMAYPGIPWRPTVAEASSEAERIGRPVLLYLHSPTCTSCLRMANVTLPKAAVRDALAEWVVPVARSTIESENAALLERHLPMWTPTVVVLSADGRAYDQWTGFLPPEVFVQRLVLALGKAAFKEHRDAEAARILLGAADGPSADLAAEA